MSRPISDALDDLDWFDAGNGVFEHVLVGPGVYPPLDDLEAQRQWLAGYAAGRDGFQRAIDTSASAAGDPRRGTLHEVLRRQLADQPELLRQLLARLAEDSERGTH